MNPYFESRSKNYSQNSRTGIWNFFRQAEFKTVVDLLQPRKGHSLLDLGCGDGFYALPLQEKWGLRVLGVDSSPGMLRALRNSPVRTLLSPIEQMDIQENFDNVLAAGVLEFIARPDLVFEKCRKILKPNGKLIVLIPTAGLTGKLYRRFHELKNCPTYVRSPQEYHQIAHRCGFQIDAMRMSTPISRAVRYTLAPTSTPL